MRLGLALLAVLLIALAALFAARREPAPSARPQVSTRAPDPDGAPSAPALERAEPAEAAGRGRADLGAPAADAGRPLRVRVVDSATLETVPGCRVWLELGGDHVANAREVDGAHELAAPIAPGSEVVAQAPRGWRLERESVELDAAPDEGELVLMALALPSGPVHGTIVDDRDGAPLPYLRFGMDGETLVTDARGAFRSAEPHASGTLVFGFGQHDYELGGFDPARDDALVVPARVGPTVYLALDAAPAGASVRWSPDALPSGAVAMPVGDFWFYGSGPERLDLDPVPRVRFSVDTPAPLEHGELWLSSYDDFVLARAPLAPGAGSLDAPLRLEPRACGIVVVRLQLSRPLVADEQERLLVTLGEPAVTMPLEAHQKGFLVSAAGEHPLEARLDGVVLARTRVDVRLRDTVTVALAVPLPAPEPEDDEDAADEEPLVPVRATIASASARHHRAWLELTRLSDGEQTTLRVEWSFDRGRWLGRVDGEAPAGAHRVRLDVEPAFAWKGPRELELPHEGELRIEIEDDVPVADVYLVPVAAEDGRPVLAFDCFATLAGGDGIGGEDFASPTVPILVGHPRSTPFDWTCSAPGWRPACGSYSPEPGDGDILIRVPLERGWGTTLNVCDDLDLRGLEGVRVLADGVLAGTTNASGYFCLGGTRPERLTLELDGWDVLYDEGDLASDGTFDDERGEVFVSLARRGTR